MLELLQAGGMDLLKAMRILIPPATQSLEYKDADLAAFYDYYAINSEPWDGPAGIVTTDARFAACTLDRNGLRPARWVKTTDRHFMIASEAGVFDVAEAEVEAKGKLGPGEMIAADLQSGVLLDSEAIDAINRARAPYKRWLKQGMTYLHSELIDPSLAAEPFDHETLARYPEAVPADPRRARAGAAPAGRDRAGSHRLDGRRRADGGAVGAGTAAVRLLPPGLRPGHQPADRSAARGLRDVAGHATGAGRQHLRDDSADAVHHVMLNSPVLSQRKLRQVLSMQPFAGGAPRRRPQLQRRAKAWKPRCAASAARPRQAVRDGVIFLLLSDRYPQREQADAARAARHRRGAPAPDPRRPALQAPTSWSKPAPRAIRTISPA